LDRRRLRYFLVVAEEQNVLRAAERLAIAQSALSRHMQMLEAELGFPLFERLPTGVRLTKAGVVYRREASKLLLSFEHAHHLARQAATGTIGTLDVGTNEITVMDARVLHLIDRFRHDAPQITPKIEILHSQAQLERLDERALDIGFVLNAPANEPRFETIELARSSHQLLIPAGHPLAQMATITKEDLRSVPLIVHRRDRRYFYYWDVVFEQFLSAGITPLIAQEAQSIATMVALVTAGCGVAFLHGSHTAAVTSRTVMRPVVDLDLPTTLSAIWRTDNPSKLLAAFVAGIRTEQ
jgi:DNA-binding transcriptional LysR family regulator